MVSLMPPCLVQERGLTFWTTDLLRKTMRIMTQRKGNSFLCFGLGRARVQVLFGILICSLFIPALLALADTPAPNEKYEVKSKEASNPHNNRISMIMFIRATETTSDLPRAGELWGFSGFQTKGAYFEVRSAIKINEAESPLEETKK
jgi:hypothetical protein